MMDWGHMVGEVELGGCSFAHHRSPSFRRARGCLGRLLMQPRVAAKAKTGLAWSAAEEEIAHEIDLLRLLRLGPWLGGVGRGYRRR